MISYIELYKEAIKARKNSYCPYSGFSVGAALLTEDGTIFHGCNIENSAYSPTVCAERCAIFKAVSEGFRTFTAIAIVGGKQDASKQTASYPCGVCRQVMSEFCDPEHFSIIVGKDSDHLEVYLLKDLLPKSFSL